MFPDKGLLSLDIETTSNFGGKISDPHQDRILMVALCNETEEWLLEEDFGRLVPLLENPDVTKIIHNASFDLKFLIKATGCKPVGIWDTLMMERLIWAGDDTRQKDLASVLATRVGVTLNKATRQQFINHSGKITDEQREYAMEDVRHLIAVYHDQMKDISKFALGKVATLENRVVPVVANMELVGISFDAELWDSHVIWMKRRLIEIKNLVVGHIECEYTPHLFDDDITLGINLNSTQQVGTKLRELGIAVESTNKDTLNSIRGRHPFIEDIIEWRLWSTLVKFGYGKYVNPVTHKVHCSWNQLRGKSKDDDDEGTRTGRFSSSNPNLQNVPKPKPDTPNMRYLFIPEDGYIFVIADYSQQEPRILAQITQDAALIAACQSGDVYLDVSDTVYGEQIEKSDPRRDDLKTGVLAVAYGSGAKGLARRLEIPLEAAIQLRDRIINAFPNVQQWSGRQLTETRLRGNYNKTLMGRIRRFPELEWMPYEDQWKVKKEALNMPVQGTGADMLKLAMVGLHKGLEPYDARIVLQIHDELVVEVRKDQAEIVRELVENTMVEAGRKLCPDVKILAEAQILERWDKV